ncbi:sensor histidine kinase [Acinetobacter soli]|uniref:sensor histidine kinase n=1 Tax=Acinetobacter soli TaxID=487316 RepID=UPI00124E3B93|nr:ATP-binding protein [Acinetobacter soli]
MPAPALSTQLSYTIYRLGAWYGAYRVIIGLSLILIFYTTGQGHSSDYLHPELYVFTLVIYTLLSFMQGGVFKFSTRWIASQLTLLFIVDIVVLSLLTYAVGTPSLHLSMLYVVTVFSAAILLQARMSLTVTLLAVIVVIYQQVVLVLFDKDHLSSISNSILLAFLFFVVYGIGQIAVRRFQLLENIANHQSDVLNQLQNINRYILDQAKEGYLVLDESYHVVVCNPAASSFLGIQPLFAHEQLPLVNLQPDLVEVLRSTSLQDGETFNFESQFSTYRLHVRIQRLRVPQQSLILLILQDAQRMNQRVQQLKLAALGQLSASIAHEIRNPLAAIAQANELLSDSELHEQQQLQNMIRKQTKRINGIIEDTLGMARNQTTTPITIQLNPFLQSLLHEDLNDVQQKLELQLPAHDVSIVFDPSQLRQVLVNLIRNALRHNAPDAPAVQIVVQLASTSIWIDIVDFGEGVTKRNLSQLFKPFFSTEIQGTGLGLYLSQSLCEANHAKLTYVEQDKGACFRIHCPIN